MNTDRPVNLDLTTIAFPLTAIISILHRISGIILFLVLPLGLYALDRSLTSAQTFNDLHQCLQFWWSKLIVLGALSALSFHFIAGVRHLLMDVGIGDTLAAGRLSAKIVLGLTVLVIGLLGYCLW